MSEILDLLNSDSGKGLINGIEKQFGLNKASVAKVLGSAIPMILGGMKNNSSSSNGASGILGAILGDNHSGGILDNIGNVLGGSQADQNVMDDGGKILGHIFGGQENNAAHVVGKSSGIDLSQAMHIMKVAAPFVLGYLGKKARSHNVSDQSGLQGLLGGLLGNDQDAQTDIASRVQGFDTNDDTLDDLAGMVSKFGKQSGGIANILSGLFS